MILLLVIFCAGYLLISLERPLGLDKSALALLTGGLCWTLLALTGTGGAHLETALVNHLSEIASIAFFLLGAMTIVEVIDSHGGFSVITRLIRAKKKKSLLVLVSLVTFFMSALLDNLTTTIVMIAITRKLLDEEEDFFVFAGLIVISANSGGVFSPIGDVTTTMLWIGGQLSPGNLLVRLFLPALVSMLIPLAGAAFMVKGSITGPASPEAKEFSIHPVQKLAVLLVSLGLLVMVPVFRIVTGLPPWLGMLLALGLVWLLTELMHHHKVPHRRHHFSVTGALTEIDLPSVLFFVGILLAVAALQTAGVLSQISAWLVQRVGNTDLIMVLLGLISSVVDNVPLVAGAMNMFSLDQFPQDSRIWELLAFCAGTGGSILIIGSAAGVTAMGAGRISFGWYLRRFSLLALAGFAAGTAVFMLQAMA